MCLYYRVVHGGAGDPIGAASAGLPSHLLLSRRTSVPESTSPPLSGRQRASSERMPPDGRSLPRGWGIVFFHEQEVCLPPESGAAQVFPQVQSRSRLMSSCQQLQLQAAWRTSDAYIHQLMAIVELNREACRAIHWCVSVARMVDNVVLRCQHNPTTIH
jgi:hypothetical protein